MLCSTQDGMFSTRYSVEPMDVHHLNVMFDPMRSVQILGRWVFVVNVTRWVGTVQMIHVVSNGCAKRKTFRLGRFLVC